MMLLFDLHRSVLHVAKVAISLSLLAAAVRPNDTGASNRLVLSPIAKLGEGAGKEISGITPSSTQPGVYWTLNDSGDEPRVYPIRADGTVVPSVRSPDTPGVLIGGAINSDWEDLTTDSAGRLIVADFGNNSNARRDLTLYILQEPEATAEHIGVTSKIVFRYPDQTTFPAPNDDRNFDAEAIFTVGTDIFILSKNRSDTFTKLYRVDSHTPGEVTTLTYLDRFDIKGQATGADASSDGRRLAILTYNRIWLFERTDLRTPFFAGKVRSREYALHDGDSDSESICFETENTLLIADEARAELYRLTIDELPEVSPSTAAAADEKAHAVRIMSYNIRFAGADTGTHAWERREAEVDRTIRSAAPDILGVQEAVALQADWLKERLPDYGFIGVGRKDGDRAGEFVPLLYRTDRFTLLASGYFWLSETPDIPGSRGWDGAFERMATWARLFDRKSQRPIFVLNAHLDHVGVQARTRALKLIRQRVELLSDGAPVVITGDFNTPAEGPLAPSLVDGSGDLGLFDTFRKLHPTRDADEATFCAWNGRIMGDRIDWIVASKHWEVIDASIERRMPDGRTGSDHYPVTAVLK